MNRSEKRKFVAAMNEVFRNSGSIVVARYAGLTVADMNEFRSVMKSSGGSVKVSKNRLAKLALEGTASECIAGLFQEQTLVAYSQDPVVAPKVTVEFSRKNENLVVVGGAMGATSLDEDAVRALSQLPSLDELRAKIVGMVTVPASRIAQVVSAPAGCVARVIGAYSNRN